MVGPPHTARPTGVRHVISEDAPEVEVGQGLHTFSLPGGLGIGSQEEASGKVIGVGDGDSSGVGQRRLERAGGGCSGRGFRHSGSLPLCSRRQMALLAY